MSSQWIIIAGNPIDGYVYVGPFENSAAASEHAERVFDKENWWVTELFKPDATH